MYVMTEADKQLKALKEWEDTEMRLIEQREARQIKSLIESHDALIAHVEDLCRKLDKLLGDA